MTRPLDGGTPDRRSTSMVVLAVLFAGLAAGCEDVAVTALDVAGLSVSPSEATLVAGDTLRIRATATDAAGRELTGRGVDWWSDDDAVASVDDGLVRAHSAGSTRIHASSGRAEASLGIEVHPAPSIRLSEREIGLQAAAGGAAAAGEIDVSNGGGGTLSQLSVAVVHPGGGPSGWLTASLDRDEAPATLSVRASPRELGRGTYRGEIHVEAPRAGNAPQVVQVALEVDESAPSIRLSVSAAGFAWERGEQAPPPQAVGIANGGGGILRGLEASVRYPSGGPTGWASARLEGSSAPTRLIIAVDPAGLEPGDYESVVSVSAREAVDSPRSIRVRLAAGEGAPDTEPDSDPDDDGDDDSDDDGDDDPDDDGDDDSDGDGDSDDDSDGDGDSDDDGDDPATLSVAAIEYGTVGGSDGDRHLLVTVRVVDGDGTPVAGAAVSLVIRNEDTGREWRRSGSTEADGTLEVRLNSHPDGCYRTSIEAVSSSGAEWDGTTPSNGYCRG